MDDVRRAHDTVAEAKADLCILQCIAGHLARGDAVLPRVDREAPRELIDRMEIQ